MVYTREAHAADEWPLGYHRSRHPQHRSWDERYNAARDFATGPGRQSIGPLDDMPQFTRGAAVAQPKATLLVDGFGPDCMSEVYSTWPERVFVLQGWPARIARLQTRDDTDEGIWTETIRTWLDELC